MRHRGAGDLARAMDWGPLEQYAPVLSTTGSAPAGQAVTGRFRRAGSLAFLSGVATIGATPGSGEYRASLPSGWVAETVAGMFWAGRGLILDVSAGATYWFNPYVPSAANYVGMVWDNGAGATQSVTSSSPFSMAAGDQLSWSLWLELDGS